MLKNTLHNTIQGKERIEKKFDSNGEIVSVSVFKDINGDGIEDLYSVTVYGRLCIGNRFEKTYIDKNGDGYNDSVNIKAFDKLGYKINDTDIEEEDINKVKEYEKYNRKMTTHQKGLYQM